MGLKVLALVGPSIRHKSTVATLIDSGILIDAIVVSNNLSVNNRLKYIKYSINKRGLMLTLNRLLCRLLYKIIYGRKDSREFSKLFDIKYIVEIFNSFKGKVLFTENFNNAKTINWIKNQSPDIIVIHAGSWVGKTIRKIPSVAIIGGHPGITPHYRGVHSAFWAIYNREVYRVGCTIFHLDSGVDTGDIILQDRIYIEKGDSFFQ